MLHLPGLYIRNTNGHGRGVFTTEAIPDGGIIELAPIILLSGEDRTKIHATHLHDYYYQWDGDRAAIALGYGSLYNHSERANAEFELDYEQQIIRFAALRDIRGGEEITTDYRVGDAEMQLWFSPS
ncbi:SET domain-containing protein-lysine N-methyltransferase [Neolewinella antarctica]|uniref:SET domain-containing protein n=1 Tax=Neolewinella antarctica TaxID=442734 RepID=A0ABX0X9Y8_9BACT|nr:SET domain-containing protein-lysine N-methyltransferase [Neolewinella antarctica]NJC26035.1 SET domain-containing protein [Neolewinella antarctica]